MVGAGGDPARARLHFMGAGGAGMSGLAVLFAARGAKVSCCDKCDSPRLRALAARGIETHAGHDPSHALYADAYVVTPAVPRDHPELAAARSRGIAVRSRGETLAGFFNCERGIAVFGTHGKTTTSVFTARLLGALGAEPGWCVGGEAEGLECNARAPEKGRLFVAEADESDGTLALYRPEISVFTSADLDHLEHFASLEEYYGCYGKALAATRLAVAVCADHPTALSLARRFAKARVATYGFAEGADVRAENVETDAAGSCFTVSEGAAAARVRIAAPGLHNVQNALGAFAAARAAGFSFEEAAVALPAACASLPARRFEKIAANGTASVYADYAHHPAELAAAVAMARLANPRRLRVVFQPHRYTRTRALAGEFPAAFSGVDELVLAPVYPAFERPVPGGTSADLYIKCREAGINVKLARSPDEAWRHMRLTLGEGDFILIAGAGDVISLADEVRRFFAAGARPAPPPVPLGAWTFFGCGGLSSRGISEVRPGLPVPPGAEILGAGSNRWFSDLATDAPFFALPRGGAARREGSAVAVPCGMSGPALLAFAEKEGLSGLEFLEGVPGTVGGWVAMNAGAHGSEISDVLESVRALQRSGKEAILRNVDCGFGYRRCKAAADGWIFEEAVFRLSPSTPGEVALRRASARARRTVSPAGLRTCGSVFANPPGDSAGRILESAGAKALKAGGARVWEGHANVIVAGEGCTGSDILALALVARAAALEKSGVALEPEIRGFGGEGNGF